MGLLDRLKKPLQENELKKTFTTEENATMSDVIEYALKDITITREMAEKIGALSQGIHLISDAIASMPVYLYKRLESGEREKVLDNRTVLLNSENSPYSTAFNMKKALISDFLYYGNGYLDIDRNADNTIKYLHHIPYHDITCSSNGEQNKRKLVNTYTYWDYINADAFQVLNLVRNPKNDDLKGQGILQEGVKIISHANGFEDYTSNTLQNGFFAKAVIEKEGILSKPSRQSLDGVLKRFFSGTKNAGKVLILDDGMKLKTVALTPAEIELLNQKEFTIKDIARILKLQPSMLGVATGGMTYTNESENQLVFLKNAIQPILILVQNTFNKYLLTEKEKLEGYFYEFSTQELLKMTPDKELKMWGQAVKDMVMLSNEARAKMNWNSIEGLDRPIINLGYGVLNEDGTITSHKDSKAPKEEPKEEGTAKGGESDDE